MRTRLLVGLGSLALIWIVAVGVRQIRQFDPPGAAPATVSASLQATAPAKGSAQASGRAIRFVKNPQPVPDFTLPDLEGRRISPADWKGKAVIINFWATWCGPCRAEIPDLVALQDKYRDRLQVVGMSVDQGPVEDVRRFVREMKMNYPVVMATPELQEKFGRVFGIPTSFVVNTQGQMVQKHVGLISPAVYEEEIRAMVGMSVGAAVETVEDIGQVFLANAAYATEIPGLDLSKLSVEEKKNALMRLNAEKCTCSCGLTLAQCRINDSDCAVSLPIAKQLVDKIAGGG